MPIRNMSTKLRLAAAAATISLGGGTLLSAVSGDADVTKDPGEHSAYTPEQLRTNWPGTNRFPLLVPARMPAGAESHPESAFDLDIVNSDPATRVWVSYYEFDALEAGHTSFRIFQRPRQMPNRRPCGPMPMEHVEFVERHIADAVVTVCSTAIAPGSSAREYWQSVPFTNDYEAVDWLK